MIECNSASETHPTKLGQYAVRELALLIVGFWQTNGSSQLSFVSDFNLVEAEVEILSKI